MSTQTNSLRYEASVYNELPLTKKVSVYLKP